MIFFLGAGFLDYQAKLAGDSIGPLVAGTLPGWLVYICSYVWCYIFCGYFAAAFVLLSFENSHKLYSSMYYVGHWVLLAVILVSLALRQREGGREQGLDPCPNLCVHALLTEVAILGISPSRGGR